MVSSHWGSSILQDARFAVRSLRKNPGFAAVALLTLALGVGANVAIFSVVKAVLLDPLPYRDTGRLVVIAETAPAMPAGTSLDYMTASALRRSSRSFARVSAFRDGPGVLLENGTAEMLRGLTVDYDFFDTLGVRVELGRNFTRSDQKVGRRDALILSHQLWVQRFGADPHVLGRVLRLGNFDVPVIGVLPQSFQPLLKASSEIPPQMYYLLPCDPDARSRNCQFVRSVGRLETGVDPRQAMAEANTIFQGILRENPRDHLEGARLALTPLRNVILGQSGEALWVVWGSAGLILLIACANVANLLLARATGRNREIALRLALGASRGRIACQLLTESMMLAFAGGGLGALVAFGGTRGLALLVPAQIPRAQAAQVDGAVLLYALGASVFAGLLFGLAPAWRGSRTRLTSDLHRDIRGSARSAVTAVEIGLAFLLTAGAALMIQTFTNLMSQGPGYDARGVLTLTTSVTSSKYANRRIQYYRDAENRLKRIAGIESVAFSSLIPMDYTDVAPLFREDRPTPGAKAPLTDYISVSTDYFRVMRIPILRGRLFTEQDNEKSPKIALINEACARAQFPGEDPIGKRIRLGAPDDDAKTVVGIVGDVRQDGIDRPADMQVYMPLNQDAIVGFYRMLARTAGDPARLEPTVRAAFTEVDRESPVYHVKALEEYVAGRLANRRFALVLLALFGALSLMLAAVGVYGVMSYTISLRTREIGVRMALGADASATVLLVLRRSMATTAAGVALGWLGALGLARSMSALLYKVRPADPMTLGGVAILLVLVALAASTLPARRAARIDPMTALRQE